MNYLALQAAASPLAHAALHLRNFDSLRSGFAACAVRQGYALPEGR